MAQGGFKKRSMWEITDPRSIEEYGAEIIDPEKISIWCQAYFYGGNTLRLWNEATELKVALLSACALGEGQNALLIGKYAGESGMEPAVSSLIGQKGQLIVEEIGFRTVQTFNQALTEDGLNLQWDFNYFDSIQDGSVDRVILFGSASHVNNWKECAHHIHRILRDEGRVIIADAPWGGKELLTAAHLDTHTEGILARLLSGINIEEEKLPFISPEELATVFEPILSWSRSFSWQGLYLFYGQKGGKKDSPSFDFPRSTEAVQAFLNEKPCKTPWDFLANAEIDILGSEITDINNQKKWARVINWGGGFTRMEDYGSVIQPMWKNLKAEPGFKVIVIGEFLERMFVPELRKRVGESGEIVIFDMNPKHRITMEKLWKYGPDIYIPERHQWDYPYADDYPDEYFDLVWLPQGVHHARSWKEIAPRLIRVLKPHGQIMMMENRTGNVEFFNALNMSGLLRCVAEKIWWGWNMTLEELPDYPTVVLEEAFDGLLYDTYSLEWKGWLLFWGYKK